MGRPTEVNTSALRVLIINMRESDDLNAGKLAQTTGLGKSSVLKALHMISVFYGRQKTFPDAEIIALAKSDTRSPDQVASIIDRSWHKCPYTKDVSRIRATMEAEARLERPAEEQSSKTAEPAVVTAPEEPPEQLISQQPISAKIDFLRPAVPGVRKMPAPNSVQDQLSYIRDMVQQTVRDEFDKDYVARKAMLRRILEKLALAINTASTGLSELLRDLDTK